MNSKYEINIVIVIILSLIPFLFHLGLVFNIENALYSAIKCSKTNNLPEYLTFRYNINKAGEYITDSMKIFIISSLIIVIILAIVFLIYNKSDYYPMLIFLIVFNILFGSMIAFQYFSNDYDKVSNEYRKFLNDFDNILYLCFEDENVIDTNKKNKLKNIILENIGISRNVSSRIETINIFENDKSNLTKYITININDNDFSFIISTIENYYDYDYYKKSKDIVLVSDDKQNIFDQLKKNITDKNTFMQNLEKYAKNNKLNFKNETNMNSQILKHWYNLLYGDHWGNNFYSFHFIMLLFIGILYIILDIFSENIFYFTFYLVFATVLFMILSLLKIKSKGVAIIVFILGIIILCIKIK
jgi:hypothetical protein